MTARGAGPRARKLKGSDYRAQLEALRDELADALLCAGDNVKAQLAGRYQAVVTSLHQLEAAERLSAAGRAAAAERAKVEAAGPKVVPQTAVEKARSQRADRISAATVVVPARRARRE